MYQLDIDIISNPPAVEAETGFLCRRTERTDGLGSPPTSLNSSTPDILRVVPALTTPEVPPICNLSGPDRFRADAQHAPIEAIKIKAEKRQTETTRSIHLVFRSAFCSRDGASARLVRMLDNDALYHWAITIGSENVYDFELTRTRDILTPLLFIRRRWNDSHFETMSEKRVYCGESTYTDDEILMVGRLDDLTSCVT